MIKGATKYQASAPSNIALLKYWGKMASSSQWPANDSLSMTLNKLSTTTHCHLAPDLNDHHITINGMAITGKDSRAHKAYKHLQLLASVLRTTTPLRVESHNTFPEACGIASSASGLAALTLAAVAAWLDSDDFETLSRQSFSGFSLTDLARLGSGSACRSLHGGFVVWERGCDEKNQKVRQLAPATHWPLADLVVLIDAAKKTVGSTEGHARAWTSPLFSPRLANMDRKRETMERAILKRDFCQLGTLMESEALEMHAVMMSSNPATFYWSEPTSRFLSWLREMRNQGKFNAFFTIDAGPNVHVMCELGDSSHILETIKNHWPNYEILVDTTGSGPCLKKVSLESSLNPTAAADAGA